MKCEDIYDRLFDVTQEFADRGATPFDVANIMSRFVVELSYGSAPNPQFATHLLLTAITDHIERDVEESEDD